MFKLILLPISLHQSKSTEKVNEIQPKIKEIQINIKMTTDPAAKMMELYKNIIIIIQCQDV